MLYQVCVNKADCHHVETARTWGKHKNVPESTAWTASCYTLTYTFTFFRFHLINSLAQRDPQPPAAYLSVETDKMARWQPLVDFTEVCGGDIFTFVIGKDKKEYMVHSGVFTRLSKPLTAMLENGMKESTTRRVILEDIDPDTFRLVLEFAYTNMCRLEKPVRGEIDGGEAERPSVPHPPDRRRSEDPLAEWDFEVEERETPPSPRRTEGYRCFDAWGHLEEPRFCPRCGDDLYWTDNCKGGYFDCANVRPRGDYSPDYDSPEYYGQSRYRRYMYEDRYCDRCGRKQQPCDRRPTTFLPCEHCSQWKQFSDRRYPVRGTTHEDFREYLYTMYPRVDISHNSVQHVNVHLFATEWMMDELQALSLHLLHRDLCNIKLTEGSVKDTCAMIREVYKRTAPADTESEGAEADLRELVRDFAIKCRKYLLKFESFKELLEEGGAFALEFVEDIVSMDDLPLS
jgi:hypothetical protein